MKPHTYTHIKKMTRGTGATKRFKARASRSSIRYTKNNNTYEFLLYYNNNGCPRERYARYISYPTREAALRDCERLAKQIEDTGKIRGFNPNPYHLRETIEGIAYLSYCQLT
jgi:hypothetical protein